jgi:plasmid stabilization system protein ParE
MPPIKWSDLAYLDLARLHAFLAPLSRETANRAIRSIQRGVQPLAEHPEIGRMVGKLPPQFREWVVQFGNGAYVVRYEIVG